MPYWLLSGSPENWEVALEKKVWGVSERAKGLWNKVQLGDIVVFYATRKTGILGYGVVIDKYVDETPLWPEEKKAGKALWPYRIKIQIKKLYSQPKPKPKNQPAAFAINKMDEETFREIIGK